MAKQLSLVKRLTKTGAITLTKDIRYLTGIHAHDSVDVEVISSGEEMVIQIKKHIQECFFCGSTDNIKSFKKYPVCKKCREELAK